MTEDYTICIGMALIQAHSCLLWGKIKILAIVTFIKGGYTMPSSNEILSGLTFSANMFRPFAIIWHLIFFALIVALLTRWKPSNRLFAMLFSLPLLSVSFFSWLTYNYFNGFVFLLASIISFTTAFKINEHPISGGMRWSSVSGSLLILFGLVYPEFLHAYSPLEYIYASPVGLIPCPTLSVITGFALIFFLTMNPVYGCSFYLQLDYFMAFSAYSDYMLFLIRLFLLVH